MNLALLIDFVGDISTGVSAEHLVEEDIVVRGASRAVRKV